MQKLTFNMKRLRTILSVLSALFGVIGIVLLGFLLFRHEYINFSWEIEPALAGQYGDFIGGFVGTFIATFSALIVALTFVSQNIENNKNATVNRFFVMLEYHYKIVDNIRVKNVKKIKKDQVVFGKRAFVVFRMQMKSLIRKILEIDNALDLKMAEEDMIVIAYNVLYYGLDKDWIGYIKQKLSSIPGSDKLLDRLLHDVKEDNYQYTRTNQTYLSAYFRNMYNAIKFIDEDEFLSDDEKYKYVAIYRAQLSNPELYILFFNLISPFGKKWKENNYVEKYKLIKDLPLNYPSPFKANDYFPMKYEEMELLSDDDQLDEQA